MNEKMRKALGFLGLVEDDYNEYAAAEPSRPYADEVREEPSWAPRQNAAPVRASAPAPRGAAVKTASVWQVREPLYRSSSGRSRHYRRELAALAAYLARP